MEQHLNSAQRPRKLSGEAALSSATAPSQHTPLKGDKVDLVPIDCAAHAPVLFDRAHDCPGADILWDYLAYGPFVSPGAMAEWMAKCAASSDPLFYVLIEKSTGQPFGMASYLNIVPTNGSIEIGHIWFAPCAQQSTLSTEAIFLMMTHALDGLKYRRLEWKCNALNAKSRNAARRFGFSFEGVFYRHIIFKGKNRDTAWFSITEEEWPRLRENFKTWLSPDNFYGSGLQKTALSSLNWP